MMDYLNDPQFMPIQNRLKLAQQMLMAGQQQSSNPWGAVNNLIQTYAGRKEMDRAENMLREFDQKRKDQALQDRTAMADLLTMQPRQGIVPATPNDDEGNAMPSVPGESPEAFSQRRAALARQMLMSENPQMQQVAMQAVVPQKKDLLTTKPGEIVRERQPDGSFKIVAQGGVDTNHFAPKDYTPESFLKFTQTGNPADLRAKEDLEKLIVMGPDGRPMINPLAVEARAEIARAGRPPPQPRAPIWDSERGMMIYPESGVAKPVMLGGQQLGGKNKDMTDAQAKANLFGTRAQEADKIINGLAQQGVYRPSLMKQGADALPIVGTVAGMMANATQSDGQQQVEQAQRDFINAVLRRESGAVISPSEFDNARQQYFPQPGDKPDTIKQKARAREIAIQGILAEVPGGKRSTPPGAAPNIDALLKKYGG